MEMDGDERARLTTSWQQNEGLGLFLGYPGADFAVKWWWWWSMEGGAVLKEARSSR